MKQLTFIKTKTLAWWDVPEPELQGPGEALVRPFIAARCDGDAFFLRHHADRLLRTGAALHVVDRTFGEKRAGIFQGPFPYGHECIAEVMRVGSEVRGVAVGDVVVVPWSVSCGACGCCTRGFSAHCERSNTPIAAYGFGKAVGSFGGMVSDLVRVPFADSMLVRLPEGVEPISVASASDNMPDAYRAVVPALQRTPGAPVLIIGGAAKSIGLYAAWHGRGARLDTRGLRGLVRHAPADRRALGCVSHPPAGVHALVQPRSPAAARRLSNRRGCQRDLQRIELRPALARTRWPLHGAGVLCP
jgi:threonine dehydrogenase-like Zn-dependent dehydrogenase